MSTRGVVGFRINGVDKVMYNHSDSYPEWKGQEVIKFCAETPINELLAMAKRIRLCKKEQGAKGDLSFYQDSKNRYMEDYHTFLEDSLFCEWGYIINLDTERLEIYKGFNKFSNGSGRYANLSQPNNQGYYGVRLLTEIDLKAIFRINAEMVDFYIGEINGLAELIEQEDERRTKANMPNFHGHGTVVNERNFNSSDGRRWYTVKQYSDGAMSCNCKGWTMVRNNQRICKHVKALGGEALSADMR